MNRSIFRQFLKYVSLNILGMIGFSCYILADTFFIADALNSTGLAALNIAIPSYSIIQATGLMLGIGGATKYSMYKAQKNTKSSAEIFTNTILTGITLSLLFALIGIFFSEQISYLLGADHETIEYTNIYIKVLLLFSPLFILNNIMLAYTRNDGNPQLSMAAMLSSSFSNIILDFIFIFPLNMGIFGAALATGISAAISLCILLTYLFSGKCGIKIKLAPIKKENLKSIVSLGISSFITEMASGVVIAVFNLVIFSIEGNTGIAAYGIVANTALVVISVFTGAAQGIQPIVSGYYAVSDIKAMKKVLLYSVITAFIISSVIYAAVFVFSDNIISVFNSENDLSLIPIAKMGLNIYFIGFFFAGFNITASAFLSAREEAATAFAVSLIRGFIAILPSVFILSAILGIKGVWLSFAAAEFITFITVLPFVLRSINTAKR